MENRSHCLASPRDNGTAKCDRGAAFRHASYPVTHRILFPSLHGFFREIFPFSGKAVREEDRRTVVIPSNNSRRARKRSTS